MIVKVCDVIRVDNHSDELVVTGTQLDRLQAATIIPERRLTIPGTYLPRHLGHITIVGHWSPSQIAQSIADSMFRDYPEKGQEVYEDWLRSLITSMADDIAYVQDDMQIYIRSCYKVCRFAG